MEYQRGSLAKHEELKSQILENPELIGIKRADILLIATEYALTKKRRAIARPDIAIFYKGQKGTKRIFIEIKSGNCRRALWTLNFQMLKIAKYLKSKKIDGEVIGIYPQNGNLYKLSHSSSGQ